MARGEVGSGVRQLGPSCRTLTLGRAARGPLGKGKTKGRGASYSRIPGLEQTLSVWFQSSALMAKCSYAILAGGEHGPTGLTCL